jgi:hypothetical protein
MLPEPVVPGLPLPDPDDVPPELDPLPLEPEPDEPELPVPGVVPDPAVPGSEAAGDPPTPVLGAELAGIEEEAPVPPHPVSAIMVHTTATAIVGTCICSILN